MKKIILSVALFAFFQMSYAQCDKIVTFKCNRARALQDGSIVQDSSMDATVSIGNGKIILALTINGETQTFDGEIKEISICKWTNYLKDGKTQYKALTKKGNGDAENSIIEIESENGYTKITFGSDPDEGSKLQLDVAEYSLVNDASTNNSAGKPIKKSKKTKAKSKGGADGTMQY